MKRKLIFANVVLVALVVWASFHLRNQWLDTKAREEAFLNQKVKPAPPPPVPLYHPLEPVKAADYIDIAQKDLFSKDRNPIVVVVPPAPPPKPPMPKLPLFHGIVDLGDGPLAIMSEGIKAPHRDYQAGDKIGAFKLVSFDREQIVLEWDGQTITKSVDELLDRSVETAPAPVVNTATVAAAPPPKQITSAPAAPGNDLGRGMKACQPGDTSPDGTVADGMRKVIKPSPFGPRCYWEATTN